MRICSLLLLLSACSGDPARGLFPTGSASIAASSNFELVYALDPDAGAIVVMDPERGPVDRVEIGGVPARLARAGDRVFVSLRDQGTVVVLDESGPGLVERARLPVGPEPFGLVATSDGASVYAAISMAGEVIAIDVASLEIVDRFATGGQPRWIALHPSGRTLYALSKVGGAWWAISPETGRVLSFALPRGARRTGPDTRPLSAEARFTGDPSVARNGRQLAMPALYVSPNPSVNAFATGQPYFSNVNRDVVGRTTPTLALFDLNGSGDPEPAPAGLVPILAINASRPPSDRVEWRRSYPTSATYSPDGLTALVTMESSRAVIAVPAQIAMPTERQIQQAVLERADGFQPRYIQTFRTDHGPRGVAFLSTERAIVDQWLDHSIATVAFGEARDRLATIADSGEWFMIRTSAPSPWLARTHRVEVGPPTLDPTLEEGRLLFFDALDRRISVAGGGTSCSTCHVDGGSDGITWGLPDGALQTPSLAGEVSLTEPVTWTSSVPTVTDLILLTTSERMGGRHLEPEVADKIAAFIDTTPYPSPPPVDAGAVERGRAIFEGSAECATCHLGPLLTDNLPHNMFGLAQVRTPTLRGIAATPPYLHDGRAQSLRDLVDIAERGGMGRTDHLSPDDKADLVAYLSSL